MYTSPARPVAWARTRRNVEAGSSRATSPFQTPRSPNGARTRGTSGEIPREFRWVRPDRPHPRTRTAPTVRGRGSARSPTTVRRHRNCRRCASRRRQDHSCSGTELESFRRRLGAESNGRGPGAGRTRCKARATCRPLQTRGPRDKGSGRPPSSTSPDCEGQCLARVILPRSARRTSARHLGLRHVVPRRIRPQESCQSPLSWLSTLRIARRSLVAGSSSDACTRTARYCTGSHLFIHMHPRNVHAYTTVYRPH